MTDRVTTFHDFFSRLYSPIRPYVRKLGFETPITNVYNRALGMVAGEYFSINTETSSARFHLESGGQIHALRNQQRESIVIDDLIRECAETDVFYDIGANIGTYSCMVGVARPEATIVSFEPAPHIRPQLERNLELNDVDATVEGIALSDSTDEVNFRTDWLNRIDPSDASGSDKIVTVRARQGDDIVGKEGAPAPDIVKIDVDGTELKVIKGLQKTLMEHSPVLYIEVHPKRLPDYGHSVSELERELEYLEYTIERLEERDDEFYWKCSK